MNTKTELFIGLMSGTSLDAIDAALIDFNTSPLQLIATHKLNISPELKSDIIKLCSPGENAINRMGKTDVQLGELFAKSVNELIHKANVTAADVKAIGSHGQTIRHMPNAPQPFTLQIGDPNIIAARTGITTVADFRRRDMALGGQAAPLAPAFHDFLLRDQHENRWVLNIGGIANLTLLEKKQGSAVIGFDTGPGNTLMDAWCMRHQRRSYDHDGLWAASGTVDQPLLDALLSDSYFAKSAPKSTGREVFNLEWLNSRLRVNNIQRAPADIQATLCELTAQTIANAISAYEIQPGSIWLCGGGSHNSLLVKRLTALCAPYRITTTEEANLHPDWMEAAAFAWLAQQTLRGLPGNLPSVTGAKQPTILGAIYTQGR